LEIYRKKKDSIAQSFSGRTPALSVGTVFSALLELLDPQRFTRGVKVMTRNLDSVMVRRLKENIRELFGGFRKREVVQIDLSGLPPNWSFHAFWMNTGRLGKID
jgi:hypothetical protein